MTCAATLQPAVKQLIEAVWLDSMLETKQQQNSSSSLWFTVVAAGARVVDAGAAAQSVITMQ